MRGSLRHAISLVRRLGSDGAPLLDLLSLWCDLGRHRATLGPQLFRLSLNGVLVLSAGWWRHLVAIVLVVWVHLLRVANHIHLVGSRTWIVLLAVVSGELVLVLQE